MAAMSTLDNRRKGYDTIWVIYGVCYGELPVQSGWCLADGVLAVVPYRLRSSRAQLTAEG